MSRPVRKVLVQPGNRVFDSVKEMADFFSVDKSYVYMVIKGRKPAVRGHNVSWYDE